MNNRWIPKLASSAFSIALVSLAPVTAQAGTLVELFTSQGCAYCPAADGFVAQLEADDPTVIAVTLNVDYWDFLGWKDTLASNENSERQVAYQLSRQSKQIFTPQFIVGGRFSFSGDDLEVVAKSVVLAEQTAFIQMKSEDQGAAHAMTVESSSPIESEFEIGVYYVEPKVSVEIEGGENAGKTIEYTNVVRDYEMLGAWQTATDFTRAIEKRDGLTAIMFVQEPEMGAVVFAEVLE